MRVLTWNLDYWTPGAYRSIENRRRQWSLIAALAPDVALLQECRPEDMTSNAPSWMAERYELIGDIPAGWQACSVVLARTKMSAQALNRASLPEDSVRWLDYLSGYVAAATVEAGGGAVRVASIHAIAKAVDDPAVLESDHERVCRRGASRAWHNDLVVAALTPWVDGDRFLVGGDWNDALLFDTNYPDGMAGGGGSSAAFFEGRSDASRRHALRKFHAEEIRTYLSPKSAPYELDHLFTDETLHEQLTSCRVLDDPTLLQLSDHAPLLADFR